MFARRATLFLTLLATTLATAAPAQYTATPRRILVYQRNGRGYVHDNLAASAQALQELGSALGLGVDVSTNTDVFTATRLAAYRAIVFANSNNEAFTTDAQRSVFQNYLEHSGGFVGIHSSTGSERSWNWFQQMQGARFLRHPPLQPFTIISVDRQHPATAHLPPRWTWTDECYFFKNVNPSMRVLLAVDPGSIQDAKLATDPGEKAGGHLPLAWCQEVRGSRRFYTSLGHRIAHYSDPVYRQHLLGGLRWVVERSDPNANASSPP